MQVMRSGEFFGRRLHARCAGGLSFNDSLHAAGSSVGPHAHSYAFFAVVVAGCYRETAQGASYECRAGNLVFHHAGEIHSNRIGDEGARVISIELGSGWMERTAQLEAGAAALGRLPALSHVVPRLV